MKPFAPHSLNRPADRDGPRVSTVDYGTIGPVRLYSTGLNKALDRVPKVRTISIPLLENCPHSVSVRVGRPTIRVISYLFPDHESVSTISAVRPDARRGGTNVSKPPRAAPVKPTSQTRIAPPNDVIKLKDRLFYLLQPPLESLTTSGQLSFPFQPFPYQYEGMAFLYPRYAAILADEMGLGKTMQAITAIRLLLRSGDIRSVLLVCPKPLVTNWQREFTLWAPEVPVGIVEGDRSRRHWQWQQPQIPIKIANYELLLRDADLFEQKDLHLDLVVLDEAQRIKNRSSSTSRVVRSISRTRSWALTGTPIENSPEDLISIFDFLMPNYLSSGMHLRRLGRAARDYILRRTKDAVLTDLPPKLYRDAELDLSPAQWDAYRTAEEQGVVRLAGMGRELTIQHVFELVLRLKQICNFDPATLASSKLERLEADLDEVAASGKKAIVFSQWVGTLDRIAARLRRFGPLAYHGKIPARRRDAVIETFRNDPRHRVLLMSYGAGSVGLNLQFCSYVFLFDRWWNPAVEDQAINRAHRIGAEGPVTVTRMVTLGTIEQRIQQVLDEKRELFAAVLSHTGCPTNLGLSQKEIFGLFDLPLPVPPSAKAA